MGFPTILPTKVVTAHHKALQTDAPHKLWLFQPQLRLELYQKTRAIFYRVLLKLLLDPDFLSFGSGHSKSSVTFSQTESSPAILLFYL